VGFLVFFNRATGRRKVCRSLSRSKGGRVKRERNEFFCDFGLIIELSRVEFGYMAVYLNVERFQYVVFHDVASIVVNLSVRVEDIEVLILIIIGGLLDLLSLVTSSVKTVVSNAVKGT